MENYTGVKQLKSGFWAAYVSGVWVNISSTNKENAEKIISEHINKKNYMEVQ